MQFQPDSGAKDIVSVEKTFPFDVEVIGITNLKLVSLEINFQDITNDITDILFQSVHCSFPIGQKICFAIWTSRNYSNEEG